MQIDIFQNLTRRTVKFKQSITWYSLDEVYGDIQLKNLIEKEEQSLPVSYETDFFSKLVNTSRSKKEPFHRWIRYREGYSGDLVKEILRRHPVEGKSEFVLDPMCGSGSTNVACRELKIDCLGLDVNPYAVLSTNTKTISYLNDDIDNIHLQCAEINTQFYSENAPVLNIYEKGLGKYFDEEHLLSLVKLKTIVKSIPIEKIRDFFLIGLLAIVEDCSNRKKDGNGLATRKTQVKSVISRFNEQIILMLEDIKKSSSLSSQSIAKCGSALELNQHLDKINEKSLGAIIFSPPYANSFDYVESYKLELVFGEYTEIENLKSIRKNLIRSYRIGSASKLNSDLEIVSRLCQEINKRIPEKEILTGIKDGRTRLVPNMLCSYFDDMRAVIKKSYDALSKNGKIHIVVDQSSYLGVPIPTDIIFCIIGKEIGFAVDDIIVCRNANTSGQQMKQYPYLKNLLRETIITLKK